MQESRKAKGEKLQINPMSALISFIAGSRNEIRKQCTTIREPQNRGKQEPPSQAAKKEIKPISRFKEEIQIQFFLSASRNESRKQSNATREPKIVESKIHPRKPQK
jgi:hypothetical protein